MYLDLLIKDKLKQRNSLYEEAAELDKRQRELSKTLSTVEKELKDYLIANKLYIPVNEIDKYVKGKRLKHFDHVIKDKRTGRITTDRAYFMGYYPTLVTDEIIESMKVTDYYEVLGFFDIRDEKDFIKETTLEYLLGGNNETV